MLKTSRLLLLLSAALCWTACGGDDGDGTTPDSGVVVGQDSGSAGTDTGSNPPPDSGPGPVDSGPAADSGGAVDSGPGQDAMVADTGSSTTGMDAGGMDAAASDAGSGDGGADDAGLDAGVGMDAESDAGGGMDAMVDAGSAVDAGPDSGPDAGPDSGPDVGGTLDLQTADLPAVTPCPDQGVLTDSTAFETLRTSMLNGTYAFYDEPYVPVDPDVFKRKCGFENFWDPTAHSNLVAFTNPNISDLMTNLNGDICSTGFDHSFTLGGFPMAGMYHSELNVAYMSNVYHLRFRWTVSGSLAGVTFASQGITLPTDLQNTLVYNVNGVPTAHANVWSAAINASTFAAGPDAPSVTLTVQRDSGSGVGLTIVMDLICASVN